MAQVFAVRDVDVDIDDETDNIVIKLTSGSGNVYEVEAGTFNRNDSSADQNRQLKRIQEVSAITRDHFMRFGSMPPIDKTRL